MLMLLFGSIFICFICLQCICFSYTQTYIYIYTHILYICVCVKHKQECILVRFLQQPCRCINTQTRDKYTKSKSIHADTIAQGKHNIMVEPSATSDSSPLRLSTALRHLTDRPEVNPLRQIEIMHSFSFMSEMSKQVLC